MPSLAEKIMKMVDQGISLYKSNLPGIDLSGKNLRGADFSCSNLRGADLSGCNLICANFENADLTDCNLENADLRYANFTQTVLDGTVLDGIEDLSEVTQLKPRKPKEKKTASPPKKDE